MGINENSRVWEGVYASFSDVPGDGDVFGDAIWTQKVLGRLAALQQDAATLLPASAATSDYALPFVAACAASPGRALRILDFGGGLGTSYLSLKAQLPPGQPLDFVVVDNDHMCRLGSEIFAGQPDIRFQSSIPAGKAFDVAHAGSSLHYVENWRGVLDSLAATDAAYLLFADVPAGEIETFVTAQWFHGRRIPVWFWNYAEFVDAVTACGFELIFKAAYNGYYLERGASLPTSHFDDRHRLARCAQLAFRRTPTSAAAA